MIVKINNKLKININYNIYNLRFVPNKLRLSKTSNKKVDTKKKYKTLTQKHVNTCLPNKR